MDIYPAAAEAIRSVPLDLPVRSAASCCPAKVMSGDRNNFKNLRNSVLGWRKLRLYPAIDLL